MRIGAYFSSTIILSQNWKQKPFQNWNQLSIRIIFLIKYREASSNPQSYHPLFRRIITQHCYAVSIIRNQQQMKQLYHKSIYNPESFRKTQVCLLLSNAFTCKGSKHHNIPALTKLFSLKEHQKHNKITLKKNLELQTKTNDSQNQKRTVERLKQSFMYNLSPGDEKHAKTPGAYLNSNDKFNDKVKNQQQVCSHRKNYYSCLQKCRMATECYDSLKTEIINKIKRKRKKSKLNSEREKTKLFEGVTKKEKQKDKQNESYGFLGDKTERNFKIRHNRHRSQSDSNKKPQRYMEMSVAQFMEQNEGDISTAITKKFEQLRKTQMKPAEQNKKYIIDESYLQKVFQNVSATSKLSDIVNYRYESGGSGEEQQNYFYEFQ